MEIELLPSGLQHIANYFDLSKLVSKDFIRELNEEDVNSYVGGWEDLEKLPNNLREKILEGVKIPKSNLILEEKERKIEQMQPEAKATTKVLLGVDGKAFDSKLVLPDAVQNKGALILPAQAKPDANLQREENKLKRIEAGIEIEKLKANWRALPLDEKKKGMTAEGLPKLQKAKLIIEEFEYTKLKLKKDAPEKVKEIFKNIQYHRDGDTLEFTHIKPYSNPAEYERNLLDFARLANVTNELNYTSTKSQDRATYHLNISAEGKDLKEVGALLNKIILLKLYRAGFRDLFGHYGYSSDLTDRGFVRFHNDSYFEMRAHPGDPQENLRNLLEIVTLPNEEATKKLREELVELVDVNVAEYLLEKSPHTLDVVLKELPHKTAEKLMKEAGAYYAQKLNEENALESIAYLREGAFGSEHFTNFVKAFNNSLEPSLIERLFEEKPSVILSVAQFLKESLPKTIRPKVTPANVIASIVKNQKKGKLESHTIPGLVEEYNSIVEDAEKKHPSEVALLKTLEKAFIDALKKELSNPNETDFKHLQSCQNNFGSSGGRGERMEERLRERVSEGTSRRNKSDSQLTRSKIWELVLSKLTKENLKRLAMYKPELFIPVLNNVQDSAPKRIDKTVFSKDILSVFTRAIEKADLALDDLINCLHELKDLQCFENTNEEESFIQNLAAKKLLHLIQQRDQLGVKSINSLYNSTLETIAFDLTDQDMQFLEAHNQSCHDKLRVMQREKMLAFGLRKAIAERKWDEFHQLIERENFLSSLVLNPELLEEVKALKGAELAELFYRDPSFLEEVLDKIGFLKLFDTSSKRKEFEESLQSKQLNNDHKTVYTLYRERFPDELQKGRASRRAKYCQNILDALN